MVADNHQKRHSVEELESLRRRVLELEAIKTEWEDAKQNLQRREERYRDFQAFSPHGYTLQKVVFDNRDRARDFIFLEVNETFAEISGQSMASLIGKRASEALPGLISDPLLEVFAQVARAREPQRCRRFVGSLDRHLEITVYSPQPGHCAAFYSDISEWKRMEEALELKSVYFRELFETTPLAIVVLDNKDCVLECNQGFETLFGYTSREAHGRPINSLIVRDGQIEQASVLSRTVLEGGVIDTEGVRRRQDGSTVDVRILAHPIKVGEEQIGIFGIYSDISRRKRDSLTRLPNRATFMERLDLELDRASKEDRLTALLAVDIARLKDVNDTYGLAVGDSLLISAAERLKATLRTGATLARLGSDEFAVLQMDLLDVGNAAGLARRLLTALQQPFEIEGHRIHVEANIGIAVAPPRTVGPKQLVSQAERALAEAKLEGRIGFKFHAADMDRLVQERMILGQEPHGALERQELFLEYQPQVDLPSRRIAGVEALLRWNHPRSGLVPPDHFVPVAEASGVIIPIGDWVVRTACSQARQWQSSHSRDLPVAVNLSAVQFKNPFFADSIVQALDDTGLPPALLELELTERILIQATPAIKEGLLRLRALGVRFALDDFGKGYSSLEYLRRLPLEKIKIDRSFVRNLEIDENDAAIVSAITVLGSRLGLKVLAEGVERQSQLELLAAEGCDEIQGYLFSPPVSAARVGELLDGGSDLIHPGPIPR
jgi:diguanylate cyclase (GGDEF)-like protein/PAS domain S-box-containing protein